MKRSLALIGLVLLAATAACDDDTPADAKDASSGSSSSKDASTPHKDAGGSSSSHDDVDGSTSHAKDASASNEDDAGMHETSDASMQSDHDASAQNTSDAGTQHDPSCPEYESLTDAISRFEGNWLVDDAEYNTTCSNATVTVLEGYPFMGLPPDPELNKCVTKHAFFQFRNTRVKDCFDPPPGCPSNGNATAFYIHPRVKGLHPDSVSERIYTSGDGEWFRSDDTITVTMANDQSKAVLQRGNTNFKRTGMTAGECTPP